MIEGLVEVKRSGVQEKLRVVRRSLSPGRFVVPGSASRNQSARNQPYRYRSQVVSGIVGRGTRRVTSASARTRLRQQVGMTVILHRRQQLRMLLPVVETPVSNIDVGVDQRDLDLGDQQKLFAGADQVIVVGGEDKSSPHGHAKQERCESAHDW